MSGWNGDSSNLSCPVASLTQTPQMFLSWVTAAFRFQAPSSHTDHAFTTSPSLSVPDSAPTGLPSALLTNQPLGLHFLGQPDFSHIWGLCIDMLPLVL